MTTNLVTLFLCGDVMLGRGVDQALGHPGDPHLRESYVRDARRYVDLAEQTSGPVVTPVSDDWPWGETLDVLDVVAPEVRVMNLETSITGCDDFAPGKAVHYRMSPDNLGALTVSHPDVCVLANNHVLDFGVTGLHETLDVLAGAGVRTAGAGRDLEAAQRPAVVERPDGRVLVVAVGAASSGVPAGWAAGTHRAGVDRLERLSPAAADTLVSRIRGLRRPGDVVVASVHWGPNWGYDVPEEQVRFAHRLVDGGVDVVHGHSSHHPKRVELYRERLVLYGCGDFIDDYEGIAGYEEYRDDLRVMYLPSLDRATGRLVELRMAVMQARRLRLVHAGSDDTRWVRDLLRRLSEPDLDAIELGAGGLLTVRPRQSAVRD